MVPNCMSYDPSYGGELRYYPRRPAAHVGKTAKQVYYYITLLNENYHHPHLPQGAEENVLRGLYLLQKSAAKKPKAKVRFLGSGAILGEVLKAGQNAGGRFWRGGGMFTVHKF